MKSQQQPEGPGASLRVDSTEDGRWTWCYSEAGTGLTLHSNETFATQEAARDWAQRAYPDVPFADNED